MMDDYIPANEAADLLHVSRATVVRLAGQGKLVGEKRFGVWFVTRASGFPHTRGGEPSSPNGREAARR